MVLSGQHSMWDWERFLAFLLIDKKVKDSPQNLMPIHSRFNILATFFSDKDFNRDNFTLFISSLKQKGYKDSYINGFIKVAKNVDQCFHINQIRDYTFFKEKYEDIDRLTIEEVKRIAEVQYPYKREKEYHNFRDYVVITFLYTTACRVGELENLLWVDVKNEPVPHVIFRDTKSNEDQTVVITKHLYELLYKMPRKTERVFDSNTGRRFHTTEFGIRLKQRAALCGINKRVYHHIFRHSKLSHLMNIYNFPLNQVTRFARHKNPQTTMRYTEPELMELMALAYASPFEKKEEAWPDLHRLAIMYLKRLYGVASNSDLLKAIQDMVEYQTGIKESLK